MTLQAEDLGKRFNREWIFKSLTYTFESGNTYAITGPNGSGKSTLMQVLWAQLPPTSGTLICRSNNDVIPHGEFFSYLSIATPYMDVIEEFTLYEMLHFHFKFKRVRGGKAMEELIDLMELPHASNKVISHFSSGMRQRLKLALAFYSDTPVIFLDEPTTNLDKKATDWYLKNLSGLPKESLTFIASNQEHEYPATALKINILDFKTKKS